MINKDTNPHAMFAKEREDWHAFVVLVFEQKLKPGESVDLLEKLLIERGICDAHAWMLWEKILRKDLSLLELFANRGRSGLTDGD